MATYRIEQFLLKDWKDWPVEENEKFSVELKSGETFETNTGRMEVSSTFWSLFENFKRLEAKPAHFIQTYIISNRDIENINNAFIRDIYDSYEASEFCKEELWLLLDRVSTNIYNMVIDEYPEYVGGYSSPEFNELYQYPPIKEVRDAILPNPKSISTSQKKVIKILLTDDNLKYHPIVIDLRTSSVKMEQFLQIILVRGFNTDIDSHIYRKPILANYFKGITDPAEVMMESTLAAKALLFQDGPLKQTEYANRRLQLSAAHEDLLITGDCGQTANNVVEVTEARFKGLLGMMYLLDGKLTPLREEDLHVIDTSLTFRMPHSCGYRDKQCVCSTCYGELSHSIPYGTNIGVTASTNTISVVSQSVLKVKHSEDSTDIESIVLTEAEQDFVALNETGEHIHVTDDVKLTKGVIVLNARARGKDSNASMIPIVTPDMVEDGIDVSKLTQFEKITFNIPRTDGSGRSDSYHVTVSRGMRKSYLTNVFIRYILANDFKVEDDGKYYISLEHWNTDLPVLELPRQHLNMRDFASEVVTFIQSSKSNASARHLGTLPQLSHYDQPTEALVDLYDLVTSKISVHMSHLSVLLLSMMVRRGNVTDYSTPPITEPTQFARYEDIMSKRSLGGLFAYEKGAAQMNRRLEQYLNNDRPPHFLDGALLK